MTIFLWFIVVAHCLEVTGCLVLLATRTTVENGARTQAWSIALNGCILIWAACLLASKAAA